MVSIKTFRIYHPVEGTLKYVIADSIAYTPAGWALYNKESGRIDKLVHAVPVGCGVEEVVNNYDKITLKQLQQAWIDGKIGLR